MLHPTRRAALAALALGAASPTLLAQVAAWPSRTVRIVVPYAAGGGVDLVARMLAERLQRQWGQSVVVENKAGGSTVIGAVSVAKAAPDGLSLLLTSEATITSNPFLFEKLPYDPVRELTPITQIVSLPQMVVAHPSVPANSMAELVALGKSRANALSYASYGSGSLPHLLFESFKVKTGADLVHVPYKGISPAVAAVTAGEVQLTLAGVSGALALLRAGKLKALAVGRATRLNEMPDVPTLREAGFAEVNPGESWFGLFATGGTPAAVVQKIQQDVAAIGNDPGFRDSVLLARGFEPEFSAPAAFAKFIEGDMRQKAQLIRISGAKAE
ncbi:tripartite tricarboxylate transporter substrate binding protein [Hydrogenophaga sp. BPS33]|nr:tripartite tricarboxylate transporter substrate binding protein [Hydrogenophaga sp. BPS33]